MNPESIPCTPGEDFEDEYFSLKDALRVIRRRFWIVALVTMVFVGAVVAFSLLQTPQYESSVKILIGQKENAGDAYNLAGDVQGLQQLILTLVEAVDSRPLAESVIEERDLQVTPEEFLEEDLSVQQIPDTQFVQVSYRDSNPERARQIANTTGEVFSGQISDVSPDAGGITATVWESAAIPEEPVSPNPIRYGALALALGLIVGLGLAFLLDYFDDRWDSPEEVEQVSGVPTFGIIPEFKISKRAKKKEKSPPERDGELAELPVTLLEPASIAAEGYRTLRTNLLYGLVDNPPKTIVLTSPDPLEGKSTTCANLGVVLAQAGKKTLIVDCDLRRPTMHKVFHLRNVRGLVNLLAKECELPKVLQQATTNLSVVSVGPVPRNPAEVLSSESFAAFLEQVREDFDYVLLDSAPVRPVADSAILASQGDGVLLILDAQNTRKGAVRQCMRSLEVVGANIIGTVMNDFKASKKGYYGNGDYTYK
jgi:capsular exopolysaccharide synthesis family protein